MKNPENFPEFAPSLVDAQLTHALVKLDMTFRSLVSLYIGDTLYAQGIMMAQLDRELEEGLSEETREVLRDYSVSETQGAGEGARALLAGDDTVFDEDEERAIVEEAQYDTVGQTFADPSRASGDVYTEAFGIVNDNLRGDIEVLLADRYPGLEVVSTSDGCIAFATQRERVDGSLERFLSIKFNTHGNDLISNVAYSYISLDLNARRSHWEPLEGEVVGGISIDMLKRDTTRAINQVIESTESL